MEQVLLDQARRQLDRQEAKVDKFRLTAGTMLASAGVVLGLLVNALAKHPPVASVVLAGIGAAALVACGVLAALALRPIGHVAFGQDLAGYEEWLRANDSERDFLVALAMNLESVRLGNEGRINRLATFVQWQAVAFASGLGCFAAALLVSVA